MVEELYSLRVEGEVPQMLVVEEMYSVRVESEGESLDKGDVVSQHFLIREVQLEDNDGVHMVVGEEVVCGG